MDLAPELASVNSDKAIVAMSLIWVGLMAALSRPWLGDIQKYVRDATGHQGEPTRTHTQPGDPAPRSVPDGCLGQPTDYWCGLHHYVNGKLQPVGAAA